MTVLNLNGQKVRYLDGVPIDWVPKELAKLLPWAAPRRCSIIVRPTAKTTTLSQLDDLTAEMVERLRPATFLALETSPGNHQAWVAMAGAECDADFSRRLRKGTGADPNASGAARIARGHQFQAKIRAQLPARPPGPHRARPDRQPCPA